MEPRKSIILTLCVTSFVVSSVVSALSFQPRILGGNNAEPHQFVYQVSLRNILHNTHFCSGAIVSHEWILTTARCVIGFNKTDVRVMYGSQRLSGPGILANISTFFIHPDYSTQYMENDIALLKTQSKMKFDGKLVGAIELPKRSLKGKQFLSVSGWGVRDVSFFFFEIR